MENSSKVGIPIGVSARHLHLTQEHLDILFGQQGYQMTVKKMLIGGEFASEEQVTIVGARLRAIESVRILGPCRKFSQLEISRTDAIKLGIAPPYRQSGDLKGSGSITLVGPKGAVYLEEGCIIAKNHIHMSPGDAENLGVSDKDFVSVRFEGERNGVFEDVLVRVDERFTLEMHLDTDEANAFGLATGSIGQIVK